MPRVKLGMNGIPGTLVDWLFTHSVHGYVGNINDSMLFRLRAGNVILVLYTHYVLSRSM